MSTDEPCGFGIVGEDSTTVTFDSGCRFDRERAVDTGEMSVSGNVMCGVTCVDQ